MGDIKPYVQKYYLTLHPNDASWLTGLLSSFSVTWAREYHLRNADIVAFFLEPDEKFNHMFGFSTELLLIYTREPKLFRRTFQAASDCFKDDAVEGRVDPLLFVLVSPDPRIHKEVSSFVSENVESQAVVPLSTKELTEISAEGLQKRFRDYLFERDLFDFNRPLTSDLYYFGRQSFLIETQDAIRSGENVGLFGLRRSGKTSLILKLQRKLEGQGIASLIYIDLEDTAYNQLRWWELIMIVLRRIREAVPALKGKFKLPEHLTQQTASIEFRNAVASLKNIKGRRIVLAFDEIEHIVPWHSQCMSSHWDTDFIFLWKSLRAILTENSHISFLLCGVNATALERPTIEGHDNPLFLMAKLRYIPSLDELDVKRMVMTLGRYMGLYFEEETTDYLLARYGGHPRLTRMACSTVWRRAKAKGLPALVTLSDLKNGEQATERELAPFAIYLLDILKRDYPDEWDMLYALSTGDIMFFEEMAVASPSSVQHLISYEMITATPPYEFRIPMIGNILRGIESSPMTARKEEKTVKGRLEVWADIGRLRNRIEPKLRVALKRILKAHLGDRWISPVLLAVPEQKRKQLEGVDANEILENRLLLTELMVVVHNNWTYFRSFETAIKTQRLTKEKMSVLLDFLNAHREDAHASQVNDIDKVAVGVVAETLDRVLDAFLKD